MKYKFKSGVVFKRICESVVNQLKNGDVLVYECKNVDLNITLNNGFINGSIVSTSLTGLTNYEIGCLEKFMMLNGYFGNGTYKTLKGFLKTFAKSEKNAIKKIENGEQETTQAREQETTQETLLKEVETINYTLLKECYKNRGFDDIKLSKNVENSVITNTIVKEFVKRNGIRDLFVLIRKFCGNIIVVYDWLSNTIHSHIKSEYTFNQTHAKYKTSIKQILLLDLIYLALYELQTIDIARKWVGTNEFDFFDEDVEKHDFTCVWFNFWLRCFIKDFLNVCKIQIGLLNRKLNKEIEQNECVTSYAEYLFYLKNKVKQDYYRLKEG